MSFHNDFPESNHIPIVNVPSTPYSSVIDSLLDPLSADYALMFNELSNNNLPYTNFKITAATQSRLDLVDFVNNGKVSLWWLIGYTNGIINPLYDIDVDKLLQIPNSSALAGSLQASVSTTMSSVDIP